MKSQIPLPLVSSRNEDFLKRLVNEASSTKNQSGVAKTHIILADALHSLGFEITWKKDPSGKTADLLVAERATGRPSDTHFITFVSHIDTVLGPIEAGPYRRVDNADGVRAYGAGIIDNKGGLAVLVESLRLFFDEQPNPDFGFRIVSSPNEEDGSSPWHEIFREFGLQSKAVLGFEPALDDGSIISSRRGNRWYDIEFRGTEAHAGRCRGEEINAAFESARIAVRMLEARDHLRTRFTSAPGLGVSIQIGQIKGGRDRHNVVCGEVQMKLDTRFSSFVERDALEKTLSEILSSPQEKNTQGRSTEIKFEIVDDCPPFSSESETANIVGELCDKIAQLESSRQILPAMAGGAGDVNHMSRPGLLVLDGLGPVGGRMHTKEEFLKLSTLQSRAEALAAWYPSLIRFLSSPGRN